MNAIANLLERKLLAIPTWILDHTDINTKQFLFYNLVYLFLCLTTIWGIRVLDT